MITELLIICCTARLMPGNQLDCQIQTRWHIIRLLRPGNQLHCQIETMWHIIRLLIIIWFIVSTAQSFPSRHFHLYHTKQYIRTATAEWDQNLPGPAAVSTFRHNKSWYLQISCIVVILLGTGTQLGWSPEQPLSEDLCTSN